MTRHRHRLDPALADPALRDWAGWFGAERGELTPEPRADRDPTRHRAPEGDLSGPGDHG